MLTSLEDLKLHLKIISRHKYEDMDIKFLGIGFLRREYGPLSTLQLIKSFIENNKNEKGDTKQVTHF